MKCKNCVFLGDVVTVYNCGYDFEVDDDDDDEIKTSFYVCNRMRVTTDSGMASQESLVDNKPNLACVTGSGSGYQRFLVEKDFFCALYSDKNDA